MYGCGTRNYGQRGGQTKDRVIEPKLDEALILGVGAGGELEFTILFPAAATIPHTAVGKDQEDEEEDNGAEDDTSLGGGVVRALLLFATAIAAEGEVGLCWRRRRCEATEWIDAGTRKEIVRPGINYSLPRSTDRLHQLTIGRARNGDIVVVRPAAGEELCQGPIDGIGT